MTHLADFNYNFMHLHWMIERLELSTDMKMEQERVRRMHAPVFTRI